MQDLLCKLENERWNWARRGVENFRKGFLRLTGTNRENKRVLIGVYGPTQVGKTTLILKILGISEDKMSIISKALRGKRKAGNSATVTSTIYQKSDGNYFIIKYPNGGEVRFERVDELEEAMSQVRSRVENNDEYSTKPLIIKIANTFFDEEELQKRKHTIEIIDLPGDDSREVKEIHHVNRCLKEFLPLCKVCILMEISSQLVSLTQLDREFVRDWRWMPSQFRIVLTRAVTSSSIIRMIKNQSFTITEQYQAFFKSELDRYAENDEAILPKIYPLEFGDSWDDFKKHDAKLYQTAKPWMDETMEQLIEDLSSAYSPQSEIEQVKDLERYAIKRSKEEFEVLSSQKDLYLEQKSEKKRSHCLLIQQKEDLYHDIASFTDQLESMEKEKMVKPTSKKISRWDSRSSGQKKTSVLKNDFYFYQDKLKDEFQDKLNSWNRKVRAFARLYNLHYTEAKLEFSEHTVGFLDSYYTIETYFRKKNFNEDCDILDERLQLAVDETFANVTKAIQDQKMKLKTDAIMVVKHKNGQAMGLQNQIADLEKELKHINQLIKDTQEKTKIAQYEWEQDIDRSRKLNEFLKRAAIMEARRLERKILAKDIKPEEKWFYYQYWNIIYQDVERITRDA